MENICALAASNLCAVAGAVRAFLPVAWRKMRYFSSHLLFDVDVETCCMPVKKKAPEKKPRVADQPIHFLSAFFHITSTF